MGVGIKNITKEKHRHKIGASSFVACHRRKKKKKKKVKFLLLVLKLRHAGTRMGRAPVHCPQQKLKCA